MPVCSPPHTDTDNLTAQGRTGSAQCAQQDKLCASQAALRLLTCFSVGVALTGYQQDTGSEQCDREEHLQMQRELTRVNVNKLTVR